MYVQCIWRPARKCTLEIENFAVDSGAPQLNYRPNVAPRPRSHFADISSSITALSPTEFQFYYHRYMILRPMP